MPSPHVDHDTDTCAPGTGRPDAQSCTVPTTINMLAPLELSGQAARIIDANVGTLNLIVPMTPRPSVVVSVSAPIARESRRACDTATVYVPAASVASRKAPEESVRVECVVPASATSAPASGTPRVLSNTVPLRTAESVSANTVPPRTADTESTSPPVSCIPEITVSRNG